MNTELVLGLQVRRLAVVDCGCKDCGDEAVDAGAFGLRRLLQSGVQFAGDAKQAFLRLGHIAHDIKDGDILCDIKQTGSRCLTTQPSSQGVVIL
jgi:hypothetical protein